ncbi:MAG TPA: hypothetical protein VI895_03005 [Bdellovibrionota bacterium]|nr:hypothetical protein [Bdellovibrionota bacterium]
MTRDSLYVQIFSMTDHAKALQDRYQGNYEGLNARLQTSQISGGMLQISTQAKGPQGEIDREKIEGAKAVVAYRHTDTGVLQGTSETLIPIEQFPWTDLPGFEVIGTLPKEGIHIKLWNQDLKLPVDRVTCIHFGKTVVYLRNYGVIDNIQWSEDVLDHGPGQLHAEEIDQDLTIAPPSGSGMSVKMGQDTKQ